MEIHAAHVDKSYGGIAVLRDVTFSAGPGVTCVEGPSGSGKTTLLRLLLGLEKPDGGTISGADCLHWAAVFQEDRLLEHLDAAGNLRFALGADFRPREAAQLLAENDALALDEPFSGLDRESRARAEEAVRRRTAGKPVLLVTHDPGDAARFRAPVIRLERISGGCSEK